MDGQIVGGWIRMLHFAADDFRQLGQLIVVTPRHLRQGHLLVSRPEGIARCFQSQQQRRRFQRPDIDRPLVAADHELPSLTALDLDQTAANGTRGFRVFEHGQRVISQAVQVGTGAANERRDPLGLAHDGDRRIDQMAAEFEHRPAGEFRQGTPLIGGVLLADHRMDLEHVAQPAFADRAKAELKSRIVAEHVAHLNRQLLAGGLVQKLRKGRQRRPRRLVQVQVHAGVDTTGCRRNQVADRRLDRHRLQARRAEQLLLAHPRQIAIGRLPLRCLAQSGVRFGHAHHLVIVRQLSQRVHFARGVRMSRADLAHLDSLCRAAGTGWPRRDDRTRHDARGDSLAGPQQKVTSLHGIPPEILARFNHHGITAASCIPRSSTESGRPGIWSA